MRTRGPEAKGRSEKWCHSAYWWFENRWEPRPGGYKTVGAPSGGAQQRLERNHMWCCI